MSESSSNRLANPAPLGLMGFGMTTILLNLHNAGFFPMSAAILAMGLCFGGAMQVVAGICEFSKGNTFGFTAFTSYGAFWLSLVLLVLMPRWGWAEASSGAFMGVFLLLWGLFTLFMFFGTLSGTRALQVVFGSLALLFFLLAGAELLESPLLTRIAGFEGLLCGASAFYLALAEVLEEQRARKAASGLVAG